MKSTIRAAAFLLAASLLAPAAVSCGENAGDTSKETSGTVSETAAETEEPAPEYLDDLPADADLHGTTIRVLGRTEESAKNEVMVEEQNGEIINDAVFLRNTRLESRLNVRITQHMLVNGADDDGAKLLQNMVTSGLDEYDLFCNNGYTTASSAYNGLLADLTNIKYLDLTKEYWSQGLNEIASIGGKQYLCSGPMSLGFFRYIMVNVFNKAMFTANDIPFPYETVLAGKWTLEAMNDIAKVLYKDLNGNNQRDAEDQYGYVTRMANDTSINDGFWSSLALPSIEKDETDHLVYAMDSGKFSSAVDKLFMLMKDVGTFNMCDHDDDIYHRFTSGLSGFSNARLYKVENADFRDMKDEYGILPMPKFDEEQENYYSLAQDEYLVYSIPVTLSEERRDEVGMFLEGYASESYLTVKPAYYEIALTNKYVNDAESAAMLDIAVSNLRISPTGLYLLQFLSSFNIMTLRDILNSGTNKSASRIEATRNSMENAIKKINETFDALQE